MRPEWRGKQLVSKRSSEILIIILGIFMISLNRNVSSLVAALTWMTRKITLKHVKTVSTLVKETSLSDTLTNYCNILFQVENLPIP